MKLVWSTGDFVTGGVAVSGFPLLLAQEGRLVRIAHLFLVDALLERGGSTSKATWRFYGYALYGFFRYLEAHNRRWDEPKRLGVPSVIASYRACLVKKAERSTVNGRLDVLVRLYEFAEKHGFISELPFGYRDLNEGELKARSDQRGQARKKVDGVKVRGKSRLIKVLSASQSRQFVDCLGNRVHQLMAQLQLSSGLRVDEVVSIPAHRIVDPRLYAGIKSLFVVTLDPREMRTKGSVSRNIHVPRELMAMLWAYKCIERSLRVVDASKDPGTLFLTERGVPYKTRSVWSIYKKASKTMQVCVHPHMLRHTYATHTLKCLSRSMNVGNALLYIKNRLGHSSILSTEIYLHCLDDDVITMMDSYEKELTSLASIKEAA